MEQGWVYMLVNSSIPGLAKIGRTVRPPAERAAELSAATGVATPFVLAFDHPFADCAAAELAVHQELDHRGLRAAPNREFFRGPPGELVRVILDVAACAPRASPERVPSSSAADMLARGDTFLFGTGDVLADLPEAVRLYRLAVARGSLVALERLGAIHVGLPIKSRAARRRAMQFLKDGARRGNYYCYCEMSLLFAQEGNAESFAKAWDLFFARRADSFLAEIEAGADRYAIALRGYVAGCVTLDIIPAHLPELRAAADALVHSLVASLDGMRNVPGARQHMALVLRWVYENLLPQPPAAQKARRTWLPNWIGHFRGAPA